MTQQIFDWSQVRAIGIVIKYPDGTKGQGFVHNGMIESVLTIDDSPPCEYVLDITLHDIAYEWVQCHREQFHTFGNSPDDETTVNVDVATTHGDHAYLDFKSGHFRKCMWTAENTDPTRGALELELYGIIEENIKIDTELSSYDTGRQHIQTITTTTPDPETLHTHVCAIPDCDETLSMPSHTNELWHHCEMCERDTHFEYVGQ